MLTSPRTNGNNNFVPGHHLALITQPVLGARSRSRKRTTTTNVLIETTPMNEKIEPTTTTTSRRNSYNDSPPLLFPISRVDLTQYQKKNGSNSHHESSDSGLDLSLSTNSSVQQQQQQQHLSAHRPLSALNEDSTPDDGYHDEHQQHAAARLRLPPVNLGRNRSMEDMLNNREQQQQHRSSSFSNDQQQQQQKKAKRSSDGALLDLLDMGAESTESDRRVDKTRSETFTLPTQQARFLNDVTNKNPTKGMPVRNETNTSVALNPFMTTHTVTRKPNTSTLKPLRKKTKLHIGVEPLPSSRLAVNDEPMRTMTNTASSSSTQTTPRANRALLQQQQQTKQKAVTPLGHYLNQEQIRAHVNRSVLERQQPPPPVHPRRGIIKQLIPFDASPAKVNNLLLRHHVQQHQPTTIYHSTSNFLPIQSHSTKQYLPLLHIEETMIENQNERQRPREQIQNNKESDRRRKWKHKEEFETTRWQDSQLKGLVKVKIIQDSIKVKDVRESMESKQYLGSVQRRRQRRRHDKRDEEDEEETEHFLTSTPRHRYEHEEGNNRQLNDSIVKGRNGNQRHQRPVILEEVTRRQRFQDPTHGGSKPTVGIVLRNKTQATINERNLHPLEHEHGSQSRNVVTQQSRPSKVTFQTFETPTTVVHSPIHEQNRQVTQWDTSKHVHNHPTWQKSQDKPVYNTSPTTRTRAMLPKPMEFHDPRQQREVSQLSNEVHQSKTTEKQPTIIFDRRSPTSWSITSEPQQPEIGDNPSPRYSISPRSPSPLHDDHLNVSSLTYRLMMTDEHQHVPDPIPKTPTFIVPSSHTSSRHTYPFNCTPDFNDVIAGNDSSHKIDGDVRTTGYVLSPRNSIPNAINHREMPSPLVHLSPHDKFDIPLGKISVMETRTTEEDEIATNYDSDDGWSDDSAELLYVDERYATQKKKNNSSSHLVQPQQNSSYQTNQQQNVLLQ